MDGGEKALGRESIDRGALKVSQEVSDGHGKPHGEHRDGRQPHNAGFKGEAKCSNGKSSERENSDSDRGGTESNHQGIGEEYPCQSAQREQHDEQPHLRCSQ